MASASRSGERGYTIIELILVIVILGTLGVVAGPRFFGKSVYDERAFMDELAVAMRYGQKVAVASGCPVRVTVTATSYRLAQQAASGGHCNASDTTFSTDVLLPSGENANGVAPADVLIAPAIEFQFDAAGRTTLTGNLTLSVGSRGLTVQADSGLVTTL
jgi:MSHA pilin protein MshC